MQRKLAAFDDPEWAHVLSLELLSRFLRNVHAEFTGAPFAPEWANYFELARQCELSAAQVAKAGYNAHATVDLPYAVAAARTTPRNARDYFTLLDAITRQESLITRQTKAIYGSDIGPLLRLLNAGAQAWIFAKGLALQDPVLASAARAEIYLLWHTTDLAEVY